MRVVVLRSTNHQQRGHFYSCAFVHRWLYPCPLMADCRSEQLARGSDRRTVRKHADMNLFVTLGHQLALDETQTKLIAENGVCRERLAGWLGLLIEALLQVGVEVGFCLLLVG